MKKILSIAFICVISLQAFSQDLDYARSIIKQLSSEDFKGRGYVQEGDNIAANYISSEFNNLGLKAFKRDYFQYFKVDVNTFPGEMSLKIKNNLLKPGEDYIVDPMSASVNGKFETYTVKKQDLLDGTVFKDLLIKSTGKFLIIDERNFEATNKEEKQKVEELTNYLKYSPEVKSAGTLILTSQKLTWGVSSVQLSKPVVTVKKDFQLNSDDNIELHIESKFIKNYKTQNVIGFVEGTEVPDSFLVLTAHYDHLGKMGEEIYFPGANDNASGIALILNLAKHFSKNPPKYSVAFMALAAEELGIVGAKYYTENPLFELDKIKFLINIDLAGTGDDGIKVVNATVYKTEFNKLQEFNQANNYLPAVKPRGAACNSDHCMFHEKGVPSFYIYTLGGIKAYHDIYDRYETLPLTEFTDYTKLLIQFMESF